MSKMSFTPLSTTLDNTYATACTDDWMIDDDDMLDEGDRRRSRMSRWGAAADLDDCEARARP
jgi:hypothetical protein